MVNNLTELNFSDLLNRSQNNFPRKLLSSLYIDHAIEMAKQVERKATSQFIDPENRMRKKIHAEGECVSRREDIIRKYDRTIELVLEKNTITVEDSTVFEEEESFASWSMEIKNDKPVFKEGNFWLITPDEETNWHISVSSSNEISVLEKKTKSESDEVISETEYTVGTI